MTVELVVALALGALLLALVMGLVASQLRHVGRALATAAAADLHRTPALVLRQELHAVVPGVDFAAPAGDSLRIRALRGVGVPCAPLGGGAVAVRYRGARLPDVAKDSVIRLSTDGERAEPLIAADVLMDPPAACLDDPHGRVFRFAVGGAPVGPADGLFLVFETGVYLIHSGAVRYRRGGGGRQPLTLEWIDLSRSALRSGAGGSIRLILESVDPLRVRRVSTSHFRSLNVPP